MDSSRSDWWLVSLPESGQSGWVPADYLEKKVVEVGERALSPGPEPFRDETGEIERVIKRLGVCLFLKESESVSVCGGKRARLSTKDEKMWKELLAK